MILTKKGSFQPSGVGYAGSGVVKNVKSPSLCRNFPRDLLLKSSEVFRTSEDYGNYLLEECRN